MIVIVMVMVMMVVVIGATDAVSTVVWVAIFRGVAVSAISKVTEVAKVAYTKIQYLIPMRISSRYVKFINISHDTW